MTGDVASEEIRHDLLSAEEIRKKFVQDRLIKKDVKFHDSLKQQKLKNLVVMSM